jgi:hypothetical protein
MQTGSPACGVQTAPVLLALPVLTNSNTYVYGDLKIQQKRGWIAHVIFYHHEKQRDAMKFCTRCNKKVKSARE